MLILPTTLDKITLTTDAATPVDVHASFLDAVATVVTGGRQNTAIAAVTTTDIVSAPGASTSRNVHTIHIRNVHAANAVGVTINLVSAAATAKPVSVTLAAGEKLAYVDGEGWRVFDVTGAER